MKAAIQRIPVFGATIRAQGKTGHAGEGAIIRQRTGNAVTRTAVRAVGEGIAEPPIGRVEHVCKASAAHGHIRADQNPLRPSLGRAFLNDKAFRQGRVERNVFPLQRGYPRQGRKIGAKAQGKPLNGGSRSLHFNTHTAIGIAYRTAQAAAQGNPVHMGPEPHTLHPPRHNENTSALCCRRVLFHGMTLPRLTSGARGPDRTAESPPPPRVEAHIFPLPGHCHAC